MKFIFVFFVCCLAIVSTNEDEARKRALKLCREEMKVTDKDLQDTQIRGCFYKCVHKKEGYVFADGGLNVNKATHGSLGQDLREKVQKDFQACAETSMGDVCRASLCLERARI